MATFSLYYPKIVLALFGYLSISDPHSDYLTDAYLAQFDASGIKQRYSWDYRFKNQNIDSTKMLVNCADIFFILTLLAALTVSWWLVSLIVLRLFGVVSVCLTKYSDRDKLQVRSSKAGSSTS